MTKLARHLLPRPWVAVVLGTAIVLAFLTGSVAAQSGSTPLATSRGGQPDREAAAATGSPPTDDQASEAKVPRLLSVNQCVDQMLAYLAPASLISVTWLSHGSADLAVRELLHRIPANHAQIEEILRLRPDRIIGGEYGAPGLQALLPRFGLTLQQLPLAEDFPTLYANWRLLGQWSDSSAAAERIVTQIDNDLATLRGELEGLQIKAVIINPNGWVAGSGSFQDAFLTRIGLYNLAAEDGLRGWGEVNLESLIRRPPDLIIVPQSHYHGGARATQWMEHPILGRIGQRYPLLVLDAEQLACGTPDLLTAAEQVRDHLRTKPARLPSP